MKIEYLANEKQRIDKYLVSLEIDELYSRSFIDRLLQDHAILVNNKPVKKNYKLSLSDIITISLPEVKDLEIKPENIPIDIVWEDDDIAIVNKPVGIVVHPGAGIQNGTLVNALMFHFNKKLSIQHDPQRPGIVHRLDKDTSGLLIVAKNDRVHSLLSRMFQDRTIKKTYLAITAGIPSIKEDTIKTLIGRSKKDRVKMTVTSDGREAVTHYKIIKYYDFFSLVEVLLETGRTHQIRVHFSHINCPIMGDNTYSTLKRTLSIVPFHYQKKVKYLLANHLKRQALHAYRLEFEHPITKETVRAEAPIPEDIQYTMDWLEKYFITE
ncbi:MAG: RluA family pseudouridine synthase [Candidatus Cloacimonetes bacterium]|jgi:23S rRNA pseudouridine1911/1915/1917 synthase|nr:RluA family pseudouridine synthase [Candidatus Cloacimonadota bacterium]MBT4331935.1 RluA family pseudouridine synthase [Candidatus Cloacimonadota bacterium]MBT4575473.1 RluA family pseudouridine synthase [Candidatus Cloacimonadota bacterium]MBT5419877.1 RluA family pseudouridine synthase [Candidatus Cloacimonadota bacterium]